MARPDHVDPVLAELVTRLREAMRAADLPEVEPDLEKPKQASHGDWATTAALRLAKPAGRNPREIAQAIMDHLDVPAQVEEVSIAGPGFLNFRLAHRYHQDLIRRVLDEQEAFGRRERAAAERETVNVEFVSANPTGPLHVGAGRWAATGDAIAELLEANGDTVVREYYVNDAGEQIRRFGESIVLVAHGMALTEAHYRGAVIREIARELRDQHGPEVFGDPTDATDAPDVQAAAGQAAAGPAVADVGPDPRVDAEVAARIGVLGVEAMRQRIEDVLSLMGVDFDVWFSERRGLHDTGAVEGTIDALTDRGTTYAQDGAVFLRTSEYGDDKDRVLIRSDGRPTYFAADCAYLRDKWARVTADGGSGRLYYLLGADHHGYVDRLRAAAACLGIPPERVEIRIGQLVNLLRGGAPVRMSKRAGETIDLDEVIEEVGVDVVRYHFLRQGLDTTVDFDLAVVAKQSMENPVYYVQYAYARINSLIRTADARGFDPGSEDDADFALLVHPAELELLTTMAQLPLVVAEAAELRATQRLARYAEDLAATFHRFYTECRILAPADADLDPGEREAFVRLGRARYHLAVAAKQVLANALGLLRVSAPERM